LHQPTEISVGKNYRRAFFEFPNDFGGAFSGGDSKDSRPGDDRPDRSPRRRWQWEVANLQSQAGESNWRRPIQASPPTTLASRIHPHPRQRQC
jgi:hypothetical protein